MNTATPKSKIQWWQMLVLGLETYLFLASFVLFDWHFKSVEPDPVLAGMLWGCILSVLGLLVTGLSLVVCRHPKWGAATFVFVGVWLLCFVLVVLPALIKASGY